MGHSVAIREDVSVVARRIFETGCLEDEGYSISQQFIFH